MARKLSKMMDAQDASRQGAGFARRTLAGLLFGLTVLPALARGSCPTTLATTHSAPVSAPPWRFQEDPAPRRSLEQLLAEARAEAAAARAALLPKVSALIASLDALERRGRETNAARIVDSLVALGLDAAPLLVQYLDPGATASLAHTYRAERVVDAIARLRSVATTDALLARTREGTQLGRLNALRALSASPEPDRVAAALEALVRSIPIDSEENRPVRGGALAALARLGGSAAHRILRETMHAEDIQSVEAVLDALAEARAVELTADVVALLVGPRGPLLATRLAAYVEAVPAALNHDNAVEGVLRLCTLDTTSRDAKLRLLDQLRRGDHKPPTSSRRDLQALRESTDVGVRRATLIYLARMKDRPAKRELFEDVDAMVKDGRNEIAGFETRAELYYLVGDHNAAVKDWREALRAYGDRGSVRPATPYIGLARSLTLLGKHKDAAEYLRQAPLSMSALHELARDRDFEGMLASRYRDAFHLPDDGTQ